MGNRSYSPIGGALTKGLVMLDARVSVGASGAVTLQTWNPTTRAYATAAATGNRGGIKSVVRTGTGLWTVTLQDSYQRLVQASFNCSNATGASTVVTMAVDSDMAINTNTAPTVFLVFSSSASTAADPASGDKIDLLLVVQNSAAL